MPSVSNRFRAIAASAREETNRKLAAEIATLTPLTEREIQSLFSTKQDKERLAELLAIVSSASAENQKAADLRRNFARLGSVAIRVLKAALV